MTAIEAHISGVVWRIDCAVGDEIVEGDTVAVLESMKMEMPVESDISGTVKAIVCSKGDRVNEGDPLVVLE
jgi:acetyl-CoA carboxylase biotin carboxyl carrier protein